MSIINRGTGEQDRPRVGTAEIKGETVDIHGTVAIHPGRIVEESDGMTQHRGVLVLHALEENYQRTELRLPYPDIGGKRGAHSVAIEHAKKGFYLNNMRNWSHGRTPKTKIIKQ